MRLLLTGANGQLGQAMSRDLMKSHEVLAFTKNALDLTDRDGVFDKVGKLRVDAVVNCAAFNDVDAAEGNGRDALAINAFGVQNLAEAAARAGVVLVHYGSDFVFDGIATSPYTEADRPNPKSIYGASKLLGEWFAQGAPRHYVLRLESVFGGGPARSSIGKMREELEKGRPARAFYDRTVTPSYVDDVVRATIRIQEKQPPFGLYHAVNSGVTTWYELALELARKLGREENLVEPVSVKAVKLRAARPVYCALSNEKLARFGIEMPTWQNALERYLVRSHDSPG